MNAITNEHRQTLRKKGYLIIRQAFDAKCVQSLVDAVEQFLEKARAGEFKRPLKWVDEERRIPVSVNNMLTPDEYQPALGEWFDADIIPTIEAIFDASTRCSWLTMLASGNGHHYRTPWHRDYCHVDHPVEALVLKRDLLRQCSFHAPLEPGDRFLQVIPGSHARSATEEEVAVYRNDRNDDMPGQLTIELEPGDIAFRHGNLLHRGLNPDGVWRRTLFAGFWRIDVPVWWEDCADREAMLAPGHLDRVPPRLRVALQQYIKAFPKGEPKSAKAI